MDSGRGPRLSAKKRKAFGYSRIVQFNPLTLQPIWIFEGSRSESFYTSIQGKQQWLPNGNVLIVEPEGGRVFEVHRETNTIVWEYINLLNSRGHSGRVTSAKRIPLDSAPFVGEPCP